MLNLCKYGHYCIFYWQLFKYLLPPLQTKIAFSSRIPIHHCQDISEAFNTTYKLQFKHTLVEFVVHKYVCFLVPCCCWLWGQPEGVLTSVYVHAFSCFMFLLVVSCIAVWKKLLGTIYQVLSGYLLPKPVYLSFLDTPLFSEKVFCTFCGLGATRLKKDGQKAGVQNPSP